MIITNNSKLGNIWYLRNAETSFIETIKNTFKCSLLTAKIIANKNILFDEIPNFLSPSLKYFWIDTNQLPNITYAESQIIDVIENKKKVGIIGDYDVDGICSSVLLKEFFEEYKIASMIWIPKRKDGYGPNDNALKFFSENPVDLLILVDCGTTAHEFKNKYDKTILIIDHHNSSHPIQNVVINPNACQILVSNEMKELCATSLTFFVISHILKKLKHSNYQNFMKSILDLTALATVCDMMPFNNLNRALVKAGIKIIESQQRIGLRQLINFANIKLPITSKDIGFAIGPRINATGRIESPEIALDLLKSKSFEECDEKVRRIEMTNNYRKEIQKETFAEATKLAQNDPNAILCLASENWNSGIVGIVAAMIQCEENKPTIIGSINNGKIKASARSNSANIGLLIEKAVELGILEQGGGHKAAAGLTCTLEKWELFKEWINNQPISIDQNCINIDSVFTLTDIDDDYKKLAPFGLGNEEPKILVHNLYISKLINKDIYYQVILNESYNSFCFFVNQSKHKLIEELKIVFANKIKFSAIFSLQEKGSNTLEDLCY